MRDWYALLIDSLVALNITAAVTKRRDAKANCDKAFQKCSSSECYDTVPRGHQGDLAVGGAVIKCSWTSIGTCSITAMTIYNCEHMPMEVGT